MAQYQSFPGASGDSRTLDKLKVLNLPELRGQTFLDVGCNEGFFCGYAKYQGAARSVGIDQSALFVERARTRFPECEFHQRSWEELPEGEFDTILLASALHYAEDQEALIHRLVGRLSVDGVLVLELGIVSSSNSAWVPVLRGIDKRIFPTMGKLREILGSYAWKWMGPSIPQDGDPVKRHVVHVRRRRPVAYLLMEPPGYGKSTISASLFAGHTIQVVSGDEAMARVSSGELPAPAQIEALIKGQFSPFTLDKLVNNIFGAGLADQLVAIWCDCAGSGDFALDAFVPTEHQEAVHEALAARGYLAVSLHWRRIGKAPANAASVSERAESFYFSLSEDSGLALQDNALLPANITGYVDEVTMHDGVITVRGWAVAPSGFMPKILAVRYGTTLRALDVYEKQQRQDVQRHFGLRHDVLGFLISLPLDNADLAGTSGAIQVMGGDSADTLTSPFPTARTGQ